MGGSTEGGGPNYCVSKTAEGQQQLSLRWWCADGPDGAPLFKSTEAQQEHLKQENGEKRKDWHMYTPPEFTIKVKVCLLSTPASSFLLSCTFLGGRLLCPYHSCFRRMEESLFVVNIWECQHLTLTFLSSLFATNGNIGLISSQWMQTFPFSSSKLTC